jgi:hypothetical protein
MDTALSRNQPLFMPAQMPLFLAGLSMGWTDRQTDGLFGHWSKAMRNGNAFAMIKVLM